MNQLPCIDIPEALYYVRLHSNSHCRLLSGRDEFVGLRQLFEPLCRETGGYLLGYCLFQSSLHLIVRSGSQGIAAMTRWLIDTHTDSHNRQHQRQGSLYSQQILQVLIEPQHYLLPAIHKLHWLPVSAGLVASPPAYPWCSHRDYLLSQGPTWLDRQEVMVKVANHRSGQLRRYEQFIEESRQPAIDWIRGVNRTYRALASNNYIQRLLARNADQRLSPALNLDTLTAWVCKEYRLETQDLSLRRRHRLGGEVQALVGALSQAFQIATVAEVADYFACDEDLLSGGIRSLKARRGTYVFKLQLTLDRWLSEHSRDNDLYVRDTDKDPLSVLDEDNLFEDSGLESPEIETFRPFDHPPEQFSSVTPG